MKRLSIALTILAVLVLVPTPRADEGMWTFDNLPLKIWKEKYGFDATPQWLERVRLATVRLNDGGTASFVSPDGLLFTNQHVAAGQLQKLSTRDKDLTRDGFYAPTRADELKCPDLEANVLVALEEVTSRVQGAAKGVASASAAAERRKAAMADIEKESVEKTGLKSEIVTLYNGGEYWLYRYKKYTDVRLVFAPEEEIAFFGGDYDNFTYPRYDVDISFLRVYENGRPASTPNYFPWSVAGASEKELVFVPGNPGSTARLLTLSQIAYQRDVGNPLQMRVWTSRLDALARYAATGAEAARRAGSSRRSLANSIKRLVGQQEGLKNPRIMGKKEAEEQALRKAVASRPEWARQYGTAWSEIGRAYALYPSYAKRVAFSTLAPSRLGSIASTLVRYAEEVAKPSDRRYAEFRDSRLESLKADLLSPAPIYADMEEAVLTGWLDEGRKALGETDPFVKSALGGQSAATVARAVIGATKLGEVSARKALIDGGPSAINASADPLIVLARRVEPLVRQLRAWQERNITSVETAGGERIARARFAVYGRTIPPDANFTLRIEYGTVLGYEEDTTLVPFKTTLAGLFDRSASFDDRAPFHLPARWKERKSALDLSTPLNFVYTADTIGGNSGSPVINRKAELVGINFDSNLQKLANRYMYIPEEEGSRAVGVHSAVVIEALAKVYDAGALVAELTGKPAAPKPTATPEQVIGKVQQRLVPDTRVAVFAVKAERKGEQLVLTGDVGQPDAKRAVGEALAASGYEQVVDQNPGTARPGARRGSKRRHQGQRRSCAGPPGTCRRTGHRVADGRDGETAQAGRGLVLRAARAGRLPRLGAGGSDRHVGRGGARRVECGAQAGDDGGHRRDARQAGTRGGAGDRPGCRRPARAGGAAAEEVATGRDAGRSQGIRRGLRRPGFRAVAEVPRGDAREHRRDGVVVRRVAVPLGRNLVEGLRLLGAVQHGVRAERRQPAARRRPAGPAGRGSVTRQRLRRSSPRRPVVLRNEGIGRTTGADHPRDDLPGQQGLHRRVVWRGDRRLQQPRPEVAPLPREHRAGTRQGTPLPAGSVSRAPGGAATPAPPLYPCARPRHDRASEGPGSSMIAASAEETRTRFTSPGSSENSTTCRSRPICASRLMACPSRVTSKRANGSSSSSGTPPVVASSRRAISSRCMK